MLIMTLLSSCEDDSQEYIKPYKHSHIALIGNNLCSRMLNFGHFETELQLRYPDSLLTIRNMCDGGDTPGFRPHSGRNTPWAFPGAEQFQSEYATNSNSEGQFEYPDEWLSRLETDIIIACFGYSESFEGPTGLDIFKEDLDSFVVHTLHQRYNGISPPTLVLVSPIAFEDLSDQFDYPNGVKENANLLIYENAIKEVAKKHSILFIDAFNPSMKWFSSKSNLTIDGSQMNEDGYKLFSTFLADKIFGKKKVDKSFDRSLAHEAVMEKNWFWHNDYKMPNGVHVFGRRYEPFGSDNYPDEIAKIRELTAIRDTAIWAAVKGIKTDLQEKDKSTRTLKSIETNFEIDGTVKYLYDEELMKTLHTAPGYKIELFASEREFPDLANPVQLSFDNRGRLWVATMPTYPHYRPGDPRPNDKILILEDTDNDGKADQQTTFAEGLHLPVGFEFAPEGVYISQGTNLKLYTDSDGDDHADKVEIIFSGFDDHDTHHVISAFCADPSGAIYMEEGIFLHTNVETSYGTVRATNGGFYRFDPNRRQLERTAQLLIPNPWGIAFDDWGQQVFAETSGPDVRWMLPGTVKPRYGVFTDKSKNLIEEAHRVRPTSGLEYISSSHFPPEVQGDLLINNTIGFLGTKQHAMNDDGTGYKSHHRQDLLWSDDKNFRPVDMEFAPDGSLYLVDWHNVLVGHMQHNARDPLRDHVHGRIYRVTYPSRPLVSPTKVTEATIPELLDNLKLTEYRSRYRSRRELRGRAKREVLHELEIWSENLNPSHPNFEHHLLEGLWVSWGLNATNEKLLKRVLSSPDFRARAAAVRVLRYSRHKIPNAKEIMIAAAKDPHGRVRLEAIVAASWMNQSDGMEILGIAGQYSLDEWMIAPYQTAIAHLNGEALSNEKQDSIITDLTGIDLGLYTLGKEIFEKDGYCGTCHQHDGKGIKASGFPPLSGTKWVLENEERLIKLTLKGLYGPINILGTDYPGQVPMTPYEGLLNDREIAAVLTYVRNSFGNKASVIKASKVAEVRDQIKDKSGFFKPEELLKEHPHIKEIQ